MLHTQKQGTDMTIWQLVKGWCTSNDSHILNTIHDYIQRENKKKGCFFLRVVLKLGIWLVTFVLK
jgi:hypothetical protein